VSVPAPTPSAEEAARVKAGRCACGCDGRLPTVRTWTGGAERQIPAPGVLYLDAAHRQRAYRQRARAGRVVPQATRTRTAQRQQAAELRRQGDELRERARQLDAESKALYRRAGELDALAAGQTTIPGLDVPRRRPRAAADPGVEDRAPSPRAAP
jgi:hypothetical protein